MEIESRMTRGTDGMWRTDGKAVWALSAIDRFEIDNAGKIRKMTVYQAPNNRWMK